MRSNLLLAVVFAALPVVLMRPYVGLLVYSWMSYMRPMDMTWGAVAELPLVQLVAIATAAGMVVALRRERAVTFRPQAVAMVLLCAWIALSVVTAVMPDLSQVVFGHYWKAIAISLLTTGLVRDARRFRGLMLLIAFSLGFHGLDYALYGLLRGGTRFDFGPGGMMTDNNSFAVALNMAIPLLVGIALTEQDRGGRRWLRWVALTLAVCSVVTIFFTFSRGGALTLLVVALLLVLRSRRALVTGIVASLALVVVLAFTSERMVERWQSRVSSIASYEEDGSAMGRINAWVTSWRVFRDYPLTGVGPANLVTVFNRYAPDTHRFRVAHSAWFQLLAECGWPALLFFASMIGLTVWRLQRLRRAHRGTPVEVWASMLQVSIAAFLVGATFLNLAYFELIYQLVGTSVGLEVAAARGWPIAAVRGSADSSATPWYRRSPGVDENFAVPGGGAA